VEEAQKLQKALEKWDQNRPLLWCAETGEARPAVTVMGALKPGPLAILIGPEGGFSQEECTYLRSLPYVLPVRLGPRVLRADTAAIAALTLVQAMKGDWTS
jgi:16S rRNA (uracil1498-N3)-methyltransferase